MADQDPTATPPARLRHVSVASAVVLSLVWAFLSWPTLAGTFRDPYTRRAVFAGLCALVVALAWPTLARGLRRLSGAGPAWVLPAIATVSSAALAIWLFRGPMNGQVMARDSCLYLLQGRALSHLHFGIPVSAPRLAFSAHFLFEGADGRLHGVFAPGYPLFLAPFAALSLPWLAGGLTAAMLTLAQVVLARTLDRDPWTLRISLLLALPSFARAIETADLLSHAFVAALCAIAVSLALRLPERPTLGRAALLGVCTGWVFSARMLDGFVLAATLVAILLVPVVRRRVGVLAILVAVLFGLPFVALVAAQQKAATGSWRTPAAVAYVHHADFPPTCLHLGFGRDVGCVVEHGAERAAFGPDGYTPDDALRLVRERTGVLGTDLFGVGALALLAFAGLALAPSYGALAAAGFALALTLAYGLFYYGNAPIYGARHVFPAAPFLWVLVARTLTHLPRRPAGWGDAAHVQGAALIAIVTVIAVAMPHQWSSGVSVTRRLQGARQDLRLLIARNHIDHAIVLTTDVHSYLAAIDPWADGDHRVVAPEDRAGDLDLRRFHPTLPVWEAVGNGHLLQIHTPTPGPGIRIELERAWPAFARPNGMGVAAVHTQSCCHIASSGDHVLYLFEAHEGSSVEIPFDVARTGRYRLHLEGFGWWEYGRWDIAVDGVRLPRWEGYAPLRVALHGVPTAPRLLRAGPHVFTARVVGKDPDSLGYLAAFDALVGEWVR